METQSTEPVKQKAKRGPRQDYGYSKAAVIVKGDKDAKYRSKRAVWYGKVMSFEGQTVAAFLDAHKNDEDSPRGWLRFFAQDGTVKLTAAS